MRQVIGRPMWCLMLMAIAFSWGQTALAADARGQMQVTQVMATSSLQVNINKADVKTLQKRLMGIGKRKAEAIVAYRDQYGRFFSAEELTAVKGIGDSLVKRNEGRIIVD